MVSDFGYTNMVMDAAREAGTGGGTVIHAKGTGMEKAEKFLGVSLASEKEITFIVARTEKKKDIMLSLIHIYMVIMNPRIKLMGITTQSFFDCVIQVPRCV